MSYDLVTYNFSRACVLFQVNETLVIVVTPRTKEAHLTGSLVEHRRVFEALFLWKHTTGSILGLVHEIQIVALVGHQEGFVLCSTLLRRTKIELSRSHIYSFLLNLTKQSITIL